MFIGDGTTRITEVYTFDNYNNPNYILLQLFPNVHRILKFFGILFFI